MGNKPYNRGDMSSEVPKHPFSQQGGSNPESYVTQDTRQEPSVPRSALFYTTQDSRRSLFEISSVFDSLGKMQGKNVVLDSFRGENDQGEPLISYVSVSEAPDVGGKINPFANLSSSEVGLRIKDNKVENFLLLLNAQVDGESLMLLDKIRKNLSDDQQKEFLAVIQNIFPQYVLETHGGMSWQAGMEDLLKVGPEDSSGSAATFFKNVTSIESGPPQERKPLLYNEAASWEDDEHTYYEVNIGSLDIRQFNSFSRKDLPEHRICRVRRSYRNGIDLHFIAGLQMPRGQQVADLGTIIGEHIQQGEIDFDYIRTQVNPYLRVESSYKKKE